MRPCIIQALAACASKPDLNHHCTVMCIPLQAPVCSVRRLTAHKVNMHLSIGEGHLLKLPPMTLNCHA